VGAHIIKMGALRGYRRKLRALMLLYRSGMPLTGWNTFNTIDLSVAGMAVCGRSGAQ
jgi:hypothetical protein